MLQCVVIYVTLFITCDFPLNFNERVNLVMESVSTS
jgi:hypothetical protein